MSKPIDQIKFGPALALGLTLTMSVASLPGCALEQAEPGELGLRSIETMIQSQTYSVTSSPEAPIVADAAILADLEAQVKPFLVDGSPSMNPAAMLTADNITVQGASGDMMHLERISGGLRLLGVEGNYGVVWNSSFTQIAFVTPEGAYRIALQGTLAERRALAATLAILGLGGTEEPVEAMAAGAWPIAAIIGLVVVSWMVLCFAYGANCAKGAEKMCPNGGKVFMTCGGASMTFEVGESVPIDGSLDLGGLSCGWECYPAGGGGDGGGGDDGPGTLPDPPTENWPGPEWETNPCPEGQSAQPCQVTETTTTTDSSGPIEEVTVTSSTTFGYCCM